MFEIDQISAFPHIRNPGEKKRGNGKDAADVVQRT